MSERIQTILGAALVVVGGVWFTQGIGVLGGSFMSGDATWTVIGAIVVIIGLALVVRAAGRRRRAKYEGE